MTGETIDRPREIKTTAVTKSTTTDVAKGSLLNISR